MPSGTKRELIEKLLRLNERMSAREHPAEISDSLKEFDRKLNDRIRVEQVNLRLKHFNIEQIRALLDFYATDIGRSIVDAQNRISRELRESIQHLHREVVDELNQSQTTNAQSSIVRSEPGAALDKSRYAPEEENSKSGWVTWPDNSDRSDNSDKPDKSDKTDKTEDKTLQEIPVCSFCNEKPATRGELVAGPGLFICRRCVRLADDILKESGFPIDGE